MKNRQRTARGLVVTGSLILFAAAALHGFAGYPALSREFAIANLKPFFDGGLRAFWLLVSWHWIAIGILALVAAYKGTTLRKFVVAMCGLLALIDAMATIIAVGVFAGNAALTLAGLAILSGAALFEGNSPQVSA